MEQGLSHSLAQEQPLLLCKPGMLAEKLASSAGLPLIVNGRRKFGGHSFRVTGATVLGAAGVAEEKIALQGRWRSRDAMLRYLRGTPLTASHRISLQVARAAAGGEMLGNEERPSKAELAWESLKAACENRKRGKEEPEEVEQALQGRVEMDKEKVDGEAAVPEVEEVEEVEDGEAGVRPEQPPIPPTRVMNRFSRVLHRAGASAKVGIHFAQWRTKCGWHFARSNDARFLRPDEYIPEAIPCKICQGRGGVPIR